HWIRWNMRPSLRVTAARPVLKWQICPLPTPSAVRVKILRRRRESTPTSWSFSKVAPFSRVRMEAGGGMGFNWGIDGRFMSLLTTHILCAIFAAILAEKTEPKTSRSCSSEVKFAEFQSGQAKDPTTGRDESRNAWENA